MLMNLINDDYISGESTSFFLLQLVVVVHQVIYVFQIMVDGVKDELKSVITMNGEPCAMIILIPMMLEWHVHSLDTTTITHIVLALEVMELDQYGWIIWDVLALN